MRKTLVIVAMLSLALVAPLQAAAAASVRLPKSATDWATFSQQERAAAYAWVWAEYHTQQTQGRLVWTTPPATSGSSTNIITPAISGSVDCNFLINNQSWGTFTNAWASTSTSASVYYIDTGLAGGIQDVFYRNGGVVNPTFYHGSPNTSYVYPQSTTDFKWSWERITYAVQSWGSAQSQSGFIFKNMYCYATVTV